MVSSQQLSIDFNQLNQVLVKDEGFVWWDANHSSRYSILASCPTDSFFLFNDHALISNEPMPISSLDEGVEKLRTWCQDQTPQPISCKKKQFPFYGGIFGFLSYELAHGLESLARHNKTKIDFPLAGWYAYEAAIVFDHEKQECFAVAQSETSLETFVSCIHDKCRTVQESTNNESFSLSFSPSLGPQKYQEAFEQVQRHLKRGDAYQINLCEHWQSDYHGSAYQLYRKLREKMSVPFGGFIDTPFGSILSFSPERFIHQDEDGTLTTEPIKGTRPRSEDPIKDDALKKTLLESKKDRAENTMIVDLMRNDLAKVSECGSIKVEKLCEVQSFPNVHHLVSQIKAKRLKNQHPIDTLLNTFPGGSITGAPKPKVLHWIDSLEPIERSIFTGSMAYISHSGQSDSNIAIRTLLHSQNQLHAWAGGGIVLDSDAKEEYQEIFNKMGWVVS